ncbi:hypothetical protein CH375_20230, partial [Leptospira ellisii]
LPFPPVQSYLQSILKCLKFIDRLKRFSFLLGGIFSFSPFFFERFDFVIIKSTCRSYNADPKSIESEV